MTVPSTIFNIWFVYLMHSTKLFSRSLLRLRSWGVPEATAKGKQFEGRLWRVVSRTGQNKMFMWLMTSTRISGDHQQWDWTIPWLLFSREVKREPAETGEPQTNPSRMRQFNCARDARAIHEWQEQDTAGQGGREAGRVTWQQVEGRGQSGIVLA